MHTTQFHLLKTRRFLPLFITQFFGAFNDNAFKSALMMLIAFTLITNSAHAQMLLNLAGGVFILPFLLFSALAGQLSDKFDRGTIIRLIKMLEILFMLTGALSFYLGSIPLMMTTLFFMGTHSTFFGPIKYSALPDLLQRQELLGGNGLVEASTFIAVLLGTILGTELGITTQGALLVSGFTLLAAALGLTSSFFIPKIPLAEPTLKINWNFLGEVGRLIGQVRQNARLFRVILVISWFWFMGFIFLTQFPVYTKTVLYGNERIVTLFLVMFSVGIAMGSLLCNRLLKGLIHTKYVPLGMVGMTLFTLDFCWASYSATFSAAHPMTQIIAFLGTFAGARIAIDLMLLSICGGFYIVPLYAILQTESQAEVRSRVIACNNIFGALFMVAAAASAILLLKLNFTTVEMFALMAAVNAAAAIFVRRKLPAQNSHNPVPS